MDLTYLKTLLGFVSNRTHDTTTSILAYWEVLEYFQELSFPQASKSGLPEDEVRVRYVRSEDELKYFIYAPYRDADSFRLYVGGVPKYDLLSELYRLIPADKDNERFRKLLEKNKSVSVLYTIDLSPSGEYIEGSFQLSPYIWAISCLIHDREVDEEWLEELLEDGNDFFMTIEDEEGIEFFSLLRQKTVELLDRLRIRSLFTVNDGFRRNDLERVCARALKSDDTDLSISFYAKDLSRVRKSLLDKRPNRLLVNYINAPLMSGGNRQSICSIENYRKWLGPERYPLGRWPSEFSPALMQQMAINIALAEENAGGCGIFSVNGPPGTGKTLLAKAVAGEANVPFFSLAGSDFVEMFVGVGASRVRDLFRQAKEKAPCIVFIDEIDAVGRARGKAAAMGGNDEREQTLNQLLTEMDGFEDNTGVIILSATNRPESLDPALTRPGRFDRRIPVELPDLKGREEILKVHAKKIKVAEDIDWNKIARMASGASGAELANIVNEAALRAVRDGRRYATQADLEESIEVVIAGYQKKNAILTDQEKRVVAYHEIGHALVAAKQNNSAPVQKITIVPRTSGALGYTMQVEEGNHYLVSKEELENKIATLTGGRAAEDLVFHSISTGAANDIEQATKLARAMITRYGMSENFGMVALETVTDQYLGGDTSLACSAETQAEIDRKVVALIKAQYEKAAKILAENQQKLDELASYLYEKETISGEEFMEILNNEAA